MLTDYSTMTPERVLRAVEDAIERADTLVSEVVAAPGPRSYDNTLAPLDRCLVLLNDAFGEGGIMGSVHPDEAVRDAGTEAEARQQRWLADLAFHRGLFEAVRDFSTTDEAAALAGERRRNLDHWLRDFRRAGQELSDDERQAVQELRGRLIDVQVEFERNLNEWEDGLDLTRDELAGLPDSYIDRLSPGSTAGTYRVSVDYPEYFPFMYEGQDRDLRRRLQFQFMNKAAGANIPLLDEAVRIRWEIASRLGYPSVAHYAMEPKMADPKAVDEFYASLVPGLTELANEELAALQALMDEDLGAGHRIQMWDWAYYDAMQRKRDYGVDDNEVASYFPLERVVAGMHDVCGDVFGLDFVEVAGAAAWHPDVKLFEIRDRRRDEAIGWYYADLHPRPGKFGHAACWRLRLGYREEDGYRKPVAMVAANLTKPTVDAPSLLKHREALELFHEFGHVLHNTLTEVELPRFSGTQTERDFNEAPSQIMENWMWEPEVLRRFARHYDTGAPIPEDLIDKMLEARDQNVALKTLRQIFLGQYDLALHGGDAPLGAEEAYYAASRVFPIPPHDGTNFGAGFGHMALDGYVAGYYGYLWSEVYGDDMFSVFSEEGVLNPEVGRRYRSTILAQGGAKDGADLLREFLGRDPSSDAFLEKIGLG